MNWEISLTIISLSFLVLTVMLVIFLLQLVKTAKYIETTLQILNLRLPEILSDLHEITKNLTYMTFTLRGKIEGLTYALEKVQKLSQIVDVLKPSIETPLLKAVSNINALRKGFSIFLSSLKAKDKSETTGK